MWTRTVAVVSKRCRERVFRSLTITVAAVSKPAMANCSIILGDEWASDIAPWSWGLIAWLDVTETWMGGCCQATTASLKAGSKAAGLFIVCATILAVLMAFIRRLVAVLTALSTVREDEFAGSAMKVSFNGVPAWTDWL